jgi:hypothetical protein
LRKFLIALRNNFQIKPQYENSPIFGPDEWHWPPFLMRGIFFFK